MILLVHKNASTVVRALKNGQELELKSRKCTAGFWELATRFPEEVIGWCEEQFYSDLDLDTWGGIFHHDLIMASYAVEHAFFSNNIGYIDQLPFIKVNREVLYGTWQMSSDVGGIKGKVLLRFRDLFEKLEDFTYLLNSVAKLGQQNSLFCYSAPQLVMRKAAEEIKYRASSKQLFSFVYQHYNSVWTTLLLWCYFKYEKKLPLLAYGSSFLNEKVFQKRVDLAEFEVKSSKEQPASASVDVIIPTMGRPKYLYQVLKDFSVQTHLPEKIIIVEQNPDINAASELPFLKHKEWPFKIVHHFIHQTGACNARNLALKETSASWVFLADDDIRFQPDFLKKAISELNSYGAEAINFNCKQEGEGTVFSKVKQWGSFGSGTSIVRRTFAEECRFPLIYEHGFGEDKDFGMQLRNKGCDIIYHPNLEILHLKAPVGGFRTKKQRNWEREEVLPKPSPTVMVYGLRHYTPQQLKGYKTSLFLRFYQRQDIRNPFSYIRSMRKRWKKSEAYALLLQEKKASS